MVQWGLLCPMSAPRWWWWGNCHRLLPAGAHHRCLTHPNRPPLGTICLQEMQEMPSGIFFFFFLVSNDILNSKYLPCFLEGECKKTPEGKLQRNGHGVHTSANGMTYIGTWKNDKVILRIPSFQTLSGLSMVCVLPYPPLDAWKRKPLPEKNQINTRLFFH